MNPGSLNNPNKTSQTYTPGQAARLLGKSNRWVLKELADGRLEGEQTATGRWKIPQSVIHSRMREERSKRFFEMGAALGTGGDLPPPLPAVETVERVRELEARIEELVYRLGKAEASAEAMKNALERERTRADRLEEEIRAERLDKE